MCETKTKHKDFWVRNHMPSEARQKKIMEKLNRAQICSILGPQNSGPRGLFGKSWIHQYLHNQLVKYHSKETWHHWAFLKQFYYQKVGMEDFDIR